MEDKISFVIDDKIETIEFGKDLKPTTTVLNYLRKNPLHKGVKEGCAEGDCGACTVVLAELNKKQNKLQYKAVDSCLIFLPMIKNKQLITIENLESVENNTSTLHPVQQAMVESNGSQCGFCTPGIVMSMFSLYKSEMKVSKEIIEDTLTGNLCRCTGYKPIIEAAEKSCTNISKDSFSLKENTIKDLLNYLENKNTSVEIKTSQQNYFQPLSLNEALELKTKHPNAILVNGATDVALRVTKRNELLEKIIDISQIEDLKKFTFDENKMEFGAGMSLEDLKEISKSHLPALYDTLVVFGSKQIRQIGTIGGNVGSCSPISDTIPIWLICDATITLQDSKRKRNVAIKDYIISYRKTAKTEEEIITSIKIDKPKENSIQKFYKISKRKDLDISTVCAAFHLELNGNVVSNLRMAYGGMAEITKRISTAEEFLIGKTWEKENIEKAMLMIDEYFTPISDARSGAEFRSVVAKNLLLKFWSQTNSTSNN